MKQALKKALAVLLAALMLLGVGGVGAGAEEIALPDEVGEVTAAAFPDGFDKDEAIELALGERVGATGVTWFKFTPAESGGYLFVFDAGGRSTPDADLYDDIGSRLHSSEYIKPAYNSGNILSLYQNLQANRAYYIVASLGKSGAFNAAVDVHEGGTLVAAKNKVTFRTNRYTPLAPLLKGTTWTLRELSISLGSDYAYPPLFYFEYEMEENGRGYTVGFTGNLTGRETIRVTAPDGESVEIEAAVKYSAWDWSKQYIFFGWLMDRLDDWMDDNDGRQYLIGFMLLILTPILFPLYFIHGIFSFDAIW